jgi:hypothetical protein
MGVSPSKPSTTGVTRTPPIRVQKESRTTRRTRSWISGTTGPSEGLTRTAVWMARTKWPWSRFSVSSIEATERTT